MEKPDVEYAVDLQIQEPKLDSERRFIAAERRYIEEQQAKLGGDSWRNWRPLKVSGLGVFRREDWEQYAQALTHYESELEHYEDEIAEGLIPFKIFVSNLGRQPDTAVSTRITVEDGLIRENCKAPERPVRLDAVAPAWTPRQAQWAGFHGFVRSKIHIDQHELAAQFSRLGAGESAELVRQTLHIQAHAGTRLRFVIHSKQVAETSGEVEIIET